MLADRVRCVPRAGTKTFAFVVSYGKVWINGTLRGGGTYTFNNMSQFVATLNASGGGGGDDTRGGYGGGVATVNNVNSFTVAGSVYIGVGGGGGGDNAYDDGMGGPGLSIGSASGGYGGWASDGGPGTGAASGFGSPAFVDGGGCGGGGGNNGGYAGGNGGYASGICTIAGTYYCYAMDAAYTGSNGWDGTVEITVS